MTSIIPVSLQPSLALTLIRAAPLGWAALALAGGLLFSDRFPVAPLVMAGLGVTLSMTALLAGRIRRETFAWLLSFATIAAFAAAYLALGRARSADNPLSTLAYPLRGAAIEGVVAETPLLPADSRVTLFVLSLRRLYLPGQEPISLHGRLRVSLNWQAPALEYGDLLRLSGTLRDAAAPTNPGQADQRIRFRTDHIDAGLTCWNQKEMALLARGQGSLLRTTLVSARRWAIGRVVQLVGAPEGYLLASMLFGVRAAIPSDMLDSFRATGLMHVLVTSGLHVGLLAWMCLSLISRLGASRMAAALGTLPILGVYLMLCGGQTPLVRSTLMFSMLIASQALGRNSSPVNALGAAAIIILFVDPEGMWDPSFQFSFAATFAIVTLAPGLIARRGFIPLPLAQVASCTLAAQLALLPLLASIFQSAPLLGAFANLLVIPAMGVFLGIGFFLLAAGWIPGLGFLLGQAARLLLTGTQGLVGLFAGLPLASIIVPPFRPIVLAAYCAWLLGLIAWQTAILFRTESTPLWPRLFCITGAAGLAAFVWRAALTPVPGNLAVTFLDVGHGLTAAVRLPSGRTLLFDGGASHAGHSIVAPFLKSSGVGRIATVIISHSHSDHIGGLIPVLRQLPADTVCITGGNFNTSAESDQLCRILLRQRQTCRLVRQGFEMAGEAEVRIRFLHPLPGRLKQKPRTRAIDENSAVLMISYRDTAILLTGDITARTERSLMPDLVSLPAETLLQVPHHGSVEGSSALFLSAVHPRHAVVCAGRFRRSPHPHPATVIRLRQQGTQIWTTARHGAITAVSDGTSWKVESTVP